MEPLYKGQVGDVSFVPYTVEPLYKGQVGDVSFVAYTVEPLYKGQVGDWSFVPYTVEPLYKGQVGDWSFVPWREVVLFSEVTKLLSLWELEIGITNLSFVWRFHCISVHILIIITAQF